MISSFLLVFRNLRIQVEIDPLLLQHLDCTDKETTSISMTVNLFRLIYLIGTIQTRRFAPSRRQKFTDKSDLLEKINAADGEFRVRINDVRLNLGDEVLKLCLVLILHTIRSCDLSGSEINCAIIDCAIYFPVYLALYQVYLFLICMNFK